MHTCAMGSGSLVDRYNLTFHILVVCIGLGHGHNTSDPSATPPFKVFVGSDCIPYLYGGARQEGRNRNLLDQFVRG